MKRSLGVVWCLVLAFTFIAGSLRAGEDEVLTAIMDARASVKPLQLPSSLMSDLTLDKAYKVQRHLVNRLIAKGESIGGFKAGLTAEPIQKKFGSNNPVWGVLFKSGEFGPDAVINTSKFVKLFIETEVGYVVGNRISEPVKDVAELKKAIKAVFPAVELPDIRFADLKNLTAVDLVADAVSSAAYIVGKPVPVDTVDVGSVTVTLTLDGQTVNQGKAADVLGDQ